MMSGSRSGVSPISSISQLRALSAQSSDVKEDTQTITNMKLQINDLESRIKALEFILASSSYGSQYGALSKVQPPRYSSNMPTLPTRPLF